MLLGIEAQDAAIHPTGQPLATNNNLDQNTKHAKVENPYSR